MTKRFETIGQIDENLIIEETPNYATVLVKGDDGRGAYLVMNKKYNVAEVTTEMLPRALEYMSTIQGLLDAYYDEREAIESPLVSSATVGAGEITH